MTSGNWGRNLLALVGIALILTGLALVVLPFVAKTSGLVAAPGASILGVGVLLVVMSAFYESSGGSARLPGWRLKFGRDTPPAQAESNSEQTDGPG
jgi:hypothetical protein